MKPAIPAIRLQNNFDLLRLLASVLVIFSHAFGINGEKDPILLITHNLPGGQLAVNIFFLISGYLISKSWIRHPDLIRYFRNRFLRIYPALILVITISVFVFGPLITTISLKEYFSNSKTYLYFTNLTLWKLQFDLPGITQNGSPLVLNAPLWTLFFEFLMYILVALFGIIGILNKKYSWIVGIIYVLLLVIYSLGIPAELFIIKISAKSFVTFFLYFFAGTFYYMYFEKKKPNGVLAATLILLSVLLRDTVLFWPLIVVSITTFVFWFAFLQIHPLKFITSKGDYSYGIYLYGYVIQNIILHFAGRNFSPLILFMLVLAGTIPFAFLSWKLVESRALKLK